MDASFHQQLRGFLSDEHAIFFVKTIAHVNNFLPDSVVTQQVQVL